MKKRILGAVLLSSALFSSYASESFLKLYHSNEFEEFNEVYNGFKNPTGTFLLYGRHNYNGRQAFALETDKYGNIIWKKAYRSEYAFSTTSVLRVLPLDDGYLIVGELTTGGTKKDGLLIKIDKTGEVIWSKRYSTDKDEFFNSADKTDYGFIITGGIEGRGTRDIWLIGVDNDGNVQWQKKLDKGFDEGIYINKTSDGNYLLLASKSEDETGEDMWIFKLSKYGGKLWERSYNSTSSGIFPNDERPLVFKEVQDGYVIFGSYDDDNHFFALLVMKIDREGNVLWSKIYENTRVPPYILHVEQTSDGGFILPVRYVDEENENVDAVLLKIDKDGNVVWQKSYGTLEKEDYIQFASELEDGYFLAGSSQTRGRLIKGDILLAKTDKSGNITQCNFITQTPNITAKDIQMQSEGNTYIEIPLLIQDENTEIYVHDIDITEDIVCFSTNQSPVIDDFSLTAVPDSLQAQYNLAFHDPDGDSLKCYIDKENDGQPDKIIDPCVSPVSGNLTYTHSGSYNVKVKIEDDKGSYVEEIKQVVVNKLPVINSFNAETQEGSLTVKFTWNVESPDNDPVTCYIDVDGDGKNDYTINSCTGENSISHTYQSYGNYTAKLTVEDDKGGKAQKQIGFALSEKKVEQKSSGGGGGGCSISQASSPIGYLLSLLPLAPIFFRRFRK